MYVNTHASHTHTHTHTVHTNRDTTHRSIRKHTGCVKQLKKQQGSPGIHGGSLDKCPMCNRDAIDPWDSRHTRVTDGSIALNPASGPEVDSADERLLADMTPEERLPCLLQRKGRQEKNRRMKDFDRRAQLKIEKHWIEKQHLAKDRSAAQPSGGGGGGRGGGGGSFPSSATTPAGRAPLATAPRSSLEPPKSVYKRRLEPENATDQRQLATEASFKTTLKAPRRTPLSRRSLMMLCQILECAGETSNRDAANELVKAMEKEKLQHGLGDLTVQEENNIRRRCYDAVNCLDGLGIVSKQHHGSIVWNGILTDITSPDAYALNQSILRAAAAPSTAHVFPRVLEQSHTDECETYVVRQSLATRIPGGMQGGHAELIGLEGDWGRGGGAAAGAARGAEAGAGAGGSGGDKGVGASHRPSILSANALNEKETLTVLRQKRAHVCRVLEHKVYLSCASLSFAALSLPPHSQ